MPMHTHACTALSLRGALQTCQVDTQAGSICSHAGHYYDKVVGWVSWVLLAGALI
jgi:hypothetical protein